MLPKDVMIEVLLRLPMKTIIHCKSVCKRWRGIVSDPYFIKLHMSTSPECLLIYQYTTNVANRINGPRTLKWVEQIEHEAGFHIDHGSSLDLSRCALLATSTFCGLGSVNGLVSCHDRYNGIIYILNPVLNEYMALPQPKKAKATLGYGFGVSSTEEYKVVRISCQDIDSFETEVYTLGTDRWKSLGLTPFKCSLWKPVCDGLYLNSHLYIQLGDYQIYDFDLTTETFELFPSPPVYVDLKKILGVVKGRISCIAWSQSLALELWVMKEGSWYKEITLKENIRSFYKGGMCRPAYIVNGLKGTSNLLVYDYSKKQLVACYLDTDTVLPLINLDGYIHEIVRYRPTFLSLHNFGSARVHAM